MMGFSQKFEDMDMGFESEPKKWVIAGIQLRAAGSPIYTKPINKEQDSDYDDCPSTPTGEEYRIRAGSNCPPAPMKRKPSLKLNYGSVRQLFKPSDLETVFSISQIEKAN